jgi:predicted phosphodiesterase
MRLALISDIHGNDIAFEVVAAAIARDGVDQIVCLGDVAGTGPHPGTGPLPGAVLERLRVLGADVVMGNVDSYMLDAGSMDPPKDESMAKFWDIDKWCAEQLTEDDLRFVAGFQPTIELALSGAISALCYHGSPASFEDTITPTTPDDELAGLLDGNHALFAGGHTHFAMVRRFGSAYVINPGSVGMAFDRTRPSDQIRFAPWAEYALITVRSDRLSIDLRRVEYDTSLVAEAIRASGMPHSEWLAAEWTRSN